jgi:RNA binding exosome subunit
MQWNLDGNREFGNLLTLSDCRRTVGLHRITWRATCTALSNLDAIADAMAWLIGDAEDVRLDKTTSYHGPEVVLIEATTKKKKQALGSMARLGVEQLAIVRETLDQRLDNEHVIHFRLDLNELINGTIVLANAGSTGQIKGQAKVEVYPGQSVDEQISSVMDEVLAMAASA